MIGIARLDVHLTGLLAASCPTGGLRNLLECTFGGTQIAALKPQICIDHPNQSQFREMIAFRHQLGADDDVHRLVFNARHKLRRFLRRP